MAAKTGHRSGLGRSRRLGWLSVTLGLLLLASWLGGPLRPLWDGLDRFFFTVTNATLGSNPIWDGIWAISNNRLFDLVAALALMTVFLCSGLTSTNRRWSDLLVRAMIGALLGLLAQVLIHELVDLRRASPTLQFPDSQRLSRLATWIATKDASRNSFPGDHGLVMFSLVFYGWRYLGARARGAAALTALLFSLPRLMAGAHWLTDLLCGSIPLGLITVGAYDGLGLAALIDRRAVPPLERWLRQFMPAPLCRWLDQRAVQLRPRPRSGAAASGRPPVASRPG